MASLYTDEFLLGILRNLADELGHVPTSHELRDRRDLPNPATYIRKFGSWRNTLARLGMESRADSAYLTDAELLDALRDLAAELDRPPTVQELMARPDLPASGTYVHRFGGWSNALEAAGLDARYRRPLAYTDKQLLDALRNLAAKLGRTPAGRELLGRRGLPSPSTYQRRFGSWNNALDAAGLEPKQRRRSPGQAGGDRITMPSLYTDDLLLGILRDLADELGHAPTCRELLERRDLPNPATYIARFEGWNNALKAAGLKARYPRHAPVYSDEELIKALRTLADELDRAPTVQEMLARDLPRPATYVNRFGSWNAALEAAGLEPNQRRQPKRGAKR